jgi:methionyl-tRNA formyltransferase
MSPSSAPSSSPTRSVFFGTPAIAVPALRALAEVTTVVGVVCQPDRPAGRGLSLSEPAVKQAARELGIEVYQPTKVKSGELEAWLRDRNADVAVVLAYGRILPPAVLSAPRRGCLNLHASLLPKYRGAAPINWCIVNGETETGVALMQMDEGLDTGPVFCERRLPIGPTETAGELAERIAELCAVVVREDLGRAVSGEIPPTPQEHSRATHAPPITREHTQIDWSQPAEAIANLIRGMAPRPGAHTRVRGKRLRLARARVSDQTLAAEPGRVGLGIGRELLVATGAGTLEILRAQLEGKKELDAGDLLNGRSLGPDDLLGGSP